MHKVIDKEYSIAVDLGTTTVELAIADNDGNITATDYFMNPQRLYGRDVINRINAASRDRRFIKLMKDMFLEAFNKSIMTILSDKSISHKCIKTICICGNTTMISILLEYDLEELGVYPFNHKLDKTVIVESKELFYEDFPLDCQVILSGCASAFIGGDILAGLISIKNDYDLSDNRPYLFLDLGTNGEMVLYNGESYFTTSTACGPAFEASGRRSNVYGSNLIRGITMGIKSGKISREGILDDEFIENGLDILGVHITADILRDILLAKAAIRTGIDILIRESGINEADISSVFLAGGFGFHLNVENAVYIGLIPEAFRNKVTVVGNTSLKGAMELLKAPSKIKLINDFTNQDVRLIQMANLPDYQDRLINNMYFKQ